MSWIKGSNKVRSQASIDAALWYWQLQTHAYWLLEEVEGFSMDDWAWEHSDGGIVARFCYFYAKTGINLGRVMRLNMIKEAIGR
jgi:hypothetical protein